MGHTFCKQLLTCHATFLTTIIEFVSERKKKHVLESMTQDRWYLGLYNLNDIYMISMISTQSQLSAIISVIHT